MKQVFNVLKIVGLIGGVIYMVKLIIKKTPNESHTFMDAVVYPFYENEDESDEV